MNARRGETSNNVWYRFHLRTTDGAGRTIDLSRDVLPSKARITITTSPAGLQLSLDGQPVSAPHSVTGVVGIERDLAAAEQTLNGRRCQFASRSDGMAASHTIATPAAATTYTATLTAPANLVSGPTGIVSLTASADDKVGVVGVEFQLDGAPIGVQITAPPYQATLDTSAHTAGQHVLRTRSRDAAGVTAPLFTYKHSAASPAGSGPGGFFTGVSIAGGAVYPSTGSIPAAYRDSCYFADHVSKFIARVDLANGNATSAFAGVALSPVDLLAGNDGALSVLTRNAITQISAP